MAYPSYSYPAYGGYNPITPFEPRNNMMQQMVSPQQPMGYGQPIQQPVQQPMMDMNQQMGQMQQPVQQMAQSQQNTMQVQQPLLMPQVKVVTSPEEANAVQVDFNGSPIIMPQVLGDDITAIYMKRWNLKEGRAEFKSFSGSVATGSVNPNERNEDQPMRVDAAALISLDDLQDLQDILENMKKFTKEQQSVMDNMKSIIRDQEAEIQSLRKPATSRSSTSKKGEDSNAK